MESHGNLWIHMDWLSMDSQDSVDVRGLSKHIQEFSANDPRFQAVRTAHWLYVGCRREKVFPQTHTPTQAVQEIQVLTRVKFLNFLRGRGSPIFSQITHFVHLWMRVICDLDKWIVCTH